MSRSRLGLKGPLHAVSNALNKILDNPTVAKVISVCKLFPVLVIATADN